MINLAPSILSADFANLGDNVKDAVTHGCSHVHIDVMDGHFVPNITIGPVVIKSLRKVTDAIFDVHLMIENPDTYLSDFASAGADIITVSYEACTHLHRTISQIKSLGKKAGVAINPATPVEFLKEVLPMLDLVLVMSVNPGFGGQSFIESSVNKIKHLQELKEKNNYNYIIEVDGGINQNTIKSVTDAGASLIVAGSAIFNDKDTIKNNVEKLFEATRA